jgi:hypothetical protein
LTQRRDQSLGSIEVLLAGVNPPEGKITASLIAKGYRVAISVLQNEVSHLQI